jgi:excisionase family DNA binding protein
MNDMRRDTGYVEPLLSVSQVSAALGVSRPSLYRLTSAGELPVVKIGDRSLFRPRDVEALIDRSTKPRP